jgi:hypothetical protein
MKKLNILTMAFTSVLFLSLPAQAAQESDQWGSWGNKQNIQDNYFSSQNVSEAELLQNESIIEFSNDSGLASGTQLAGTPFNELDTNPIELNEDGIPIELADK